VLSNIGLKYTSVRSQKDNIIFDSFSSLDLYQVNAYANVFNSTPDFIFTNNNDLTAEFSNLTLVSVDCYQPSLQLILDFNSHNDHECFESFLDFKNTYYTIINNYLNNIDWSIMYHLNDVNTATNLLKK